MQHNEGIRNKNGRKMRGRGREILEKIRNLVEDLDTEREPQIKFLKKAEVGGSSWIAALAASFDPPTCAHLGLVEAARRKGASEILVLLDKVNADKRTFGAPIEERLHLLLKLFEEDPAISVGLSSHPLFVHKLQALRRICPEGTRISFIVGYDTIVRILDPKYYRDRDEELSLLFEGADFLVAPRGDRGEEDIIALFELPENRKYRGKIEILRVSGFEHISATMIREKVRRGEDVRGLVPEEILADVLEIYGHEGRRDEASARNRSR